MLIGYARVSTEEQNLDLQVAELKKAGAEHIYTDKKSGKDMNRPGWQSAIMDLREGDTLIVWKVDRIARSVKHLVNILEEFRDEGIELVVTSQGMDTRTPMGRFAFNIMASMAEMERELISERTKAGIAVLKERGFIPGPIPRITPEIWDYAVNQLKERPNLSANALSRMIAQDVQKRGEKRIAAGSIYKVLPQMRQGEPYPDHWKARLEQAKDREREKRRALKK